MRHLFSFGRYLLVVPILVILLASLVLIVFEACALAITLTDLAAAGPALSLKSAKTLAVGLIEVVDVFLIAIAMYIISLSLHVLFIDETLPVPSWLRVRDLEDLKSNLVSLVIVVLAVMFLREAVAWDHDGDILRLGAALALMIVALGVYLAKKTGGRPAPGPAAGAPAGVAPSQPDGSAGQPPAPAPASGPHLDG